MRTRALAGASTLVVVSDHGFASYTKVIQPNVVLRGLGLVDADGAGKVTARRAWSVAQGGSAFVYLSGRYGVGAQNG